MSSDPSDNAPILSSDPSVSEPALSAIPSAEASTPLIVPPVGAPVSSTILPTAHASTSTIVSFSPSDLRPFPKAGARKKTGKEHKRQGRTRILTDTPEKKELEERIAAKCLGKKKGQSGTQSSIEKTTVKRSSSTRDKQAVKKNKPKQPDTSDEEDWPCLVCCEPFVNSKSKEKWIKCVECGKWAHEDCTDYCKGQIAYVCDNCRSDVEEDSE